MSSCWFLEQSRVCLDNKDVKNTFTNQSLRSDHRFPICGHVVIYILRVVLFSVLFSLLFASEVDAPFARWSKDQVCDWLQEQGLGLYVNMARVWISSGQTLLQASQVDLERVRWSRRTESVQRLLKFLGSTFVSEHAFLRTCRSWALNTHCTRRSCSWLCRPSAQRRRIIRESWTTTGWPVSTSCQSKA